MIERVREALEGKTVESVGETKGGWVSIWTRDGAGVHVQWNALRVDGPPDGVTPEEPKR